MCTGVKVSESDSDRVEDPLRDEMGLLGSMLGETIREIAGESAFHSVEELRSLAWHRRSGREEADRQMMDFIAALDDEQLRVTIRAFTIFMDLLNLAEDRQRLRILAQRSESCYPAPRRESIGEAVRELKSLGITPHEMQGLLDQLQIELVFTAHPTDAKRRSVRHKLRRLRELLIERQSSSSPTQKEDVRGQIRGELVKLWQTDFIRPWRPSVMQEIGRGLSIKPVLWQTAPKIQEELADAVGRYYGSDIDVSRPALKFGSWIGGDRDGHPGVTAEITRQTLGWLREAALKFHLDYCEELFDSLSLSERQTQFPDELRQAIGRAVDRWGALEEKLAELPPGELCRRWLMVIQWRLERTQNVSLDGAQIEGAYGEPDELSADITVLLEAVSSLPGSDLPAKEVRFWLTRSRVFGLHLARLDVRQDARVYREVLNEVLRLAQLADAPETLSEQQRQQVIVESLDHRLALDSGELSPIAQDTLELFRLLRQAVSAFGREAIGGHVISMTAAPSDVLTVLWLWKHAEGTVHKHSCALPIVPLFETIDDLQNAPGVFRGMLAVPAYRDHLREQGDRQIIMLGYSDSTKDGGYLSACWALHQAQKQLVAVAREEGIKLTFFHGRGGSLGRGGGPAARSILSLPAGTFHGSLRLTEQGEVLADRYDDPAIANRHLEQVLWSSLLAAGRPVVEENPKWSATMDKLSSHSHQRYRELVEQPDFVEFFRRATPISEIEQLPIGSRPARRRGGASLSDLRAIPWVFSWTQCRCLLPAWYGLGTAIESLLWNPEELDELQLMYRNWQFFRACIDNAELALAKTDLDISRLYATLANDSESLRKIASMISDEYHRSCQAVLALTQQNGLLDGTPWLKESIRVRNRYIDPLNLIQVELLRRARADHMPQAEEELRHLSRLSINGVAAGMRTSG